MNPPTTAKDSPADGMATGLPENAYRELKPGETYIPMVPPGVIAPELTLRSVLFGIAMNVLWAAAATYVALKVGQGIETAIPISILAVGLSGLLLRLGLRRSTIIENVNILAISTTSGMVAGGTVFTMPAIYLLGLPEGLGLGSGTVFLHIFLVPLFGAVFGVIFLVPFRRYFVKEMHGKLPFPEATATNEILVTGQGGGSGAVTLIISTAISTAYTFCASGLKLWSEAFTTGKVEVPKGETAHAADLLSGLTDRVKAIFTMGTGAEYAGLGFIIGLRYASIIMAGSILSCLVLVPLFAPLDLASLKSINPMATGTTAGDLFNAVPKSIGIGCIFAAGILSILKMSPVIVTALREALGSLLRRGGVAAAPERTDRDIGYPALILLGLLTTAALAVYFRTAVLPGTESPNLLTAAAVLLAIGVAFIFITVSAWAIATISVTPISGMTVTTLIVTAVLLMAAGLPKGPGGQLAVLLVGGVVATALSVAGTLVTEFKIGYWTGSSPRRIQWSCLCACALASAVVAGTLMLLASTPPGFDPGSPGALRAPQANLMRGVLAAFLGTGDVAPPWILYGVGVMIALMLQLVGVSPLAFGLGMFLPMENNAPILVGAVAAAIVKAGGASDAIRRLRETRGTIVASGFIAGAAILGVLLKGLKSFKGTGSAFDWIDVPARLVGSGLDPVSVGRALNWAGLGAFLLLCVLIVAWSRRARA
jgi:putative OPT family oligopeptide transporter